jgi:hypothetical protein
MASNDVELSEEQQLDSPQAHPSLGARSAFVVHGDLEKAVDRLRLNATIFAMSSSSWRRPLAFCALHVSRMRDQTFSSTRIFGSRHAIFQLSSARFFSKFAR